MIKKPSKPHRVILPEEIPTEADTQERINKIDELQSLGIKVNTLDGTDGVEKDIEKLDLR